jgi:hypothetical protein
MAVVVDDRMRQRFRRGWAAFVTHEVTMSEARHARTRCTRANLTPFIRSYLDVLDRSGDDGVRPTIPDGRGVGTVTLEVATAASLVIATIAVWRVVAVTRARGERGASDDSFMKKVVKVSLVVMLVAGGIVWLLERAEDNPPDSGSGERPPGQSDRNPGDGGKNR